MNITQLAVHNHSLTPNLAQLSGLNPEPTAGGGQDVLQETFQQFVGETFFQMMLKSLRKTHAKPAYLHGGQAEEIFQGQLDQELAANLAQNAGASFSEDLYQLFRLQLDHPPLSSTLPVQSEKQQASAHDPVRDLASV